MVIREYLPGRGEVRDRGFCRGRGPVGSGRNDPGRDHDLSRYVLEEGARVGLGTDGAASNNDLDMWGEMDSAAKLHKLVSNRPTVLPALQVLEMATVGGARALHMEDKIGSLETGKRADIILVDLKAPHLIPLYNIYSQLVYATKGADVTHVWVDGRLLMADRELLTLDETAIFREAERYRKKIEAGRDEQPDVPDL